MDRVALVLRHAAEVADEHLAQSDRIIKLYVVSAGILIKIGLKTINSHNRIIYWEDICINHNNPITIAIADMILAIEGENQQ